MDSCSTASFRVECVRQLIGTVERLPGLDMLDLCLVGLCRQHHASATVELCSGPFEEPTLCALFTRAHVHFFSLAFMSLYWW